MKNTALNITGAKAVHPLFRYLRQRIYQRLSLELKDNVLDLPKLDLTFNESYLTGFVQENELSEDEVFLLLLALVPHIAPNFLADIITDFLPNGGEFPEFGGVKGKNHRGILPTGETAVYLLTGTEIENRLSMVKWLTEKAILFKKGILVLDSVPTGEPFLSGRLLIDDEYVSKLTTGRLLKPKLGPNFPASRIETALEWEDLVLAKKTIAEIQEIQTWLKFSPILMEDWGMKNRIKPGYRVVFYGPSGTGKTLTATLLGKYTQRDVYRVDLSMVVSKYIGETEKNLSGLFNKALDKDWILFFDEADAIFGKRTNVKDAHDKHANQEVAYLLQRIESHPGLVILASNFKSNIDTAFTRRFQSMIAFEAPTYRERLLLWKKNLPKKIELDKSVHLDELSKKYALTGSNIVNIIQYACLKTLEKGDKTIQAGYLEEGIRKEYTKEGKTLGF